MKNIFTEHPRGIGESYWEHALYAGGVGFILFYLSCVSFVHAVCPFLFPFTVSRHLQALSKEALARWERMNQRTRIKQTHFGNHHDDI